MAIGFKNEPLHHGHFGHILEERSPFQTAMFWYALNCVETSLSYLQHSKWPRAMGLVSIMLSYLRSCSQVHKIMFAHDFDLGFSQPCVSTNTPVSRFPERGNVPT